MAASVAKSEGNLSMPSQLYPLGKLLKKEMKE